MKYKRRDPGLDYLIGKEVEILFKDGDAKIGILEFNDWATALFYPGWYRVGELCFRKTQVSKYRLKDAAEWQRIKRR